MTRIFAVEPKNDPEMKLNWSDVINVLVALAIFKVLDKMFLDEALSGITGGAEAYERRV